MSYVTKNQTSLALIVIVFTTIMIAGTIVSAADNLAFASRNNHNHFNHFNDKSSNNHQRIGQSSDQRQHSFCLTAGFGSPVSASCNNTAASANANTGGNGAASDNNGNIGTHQKVGQSGHQHQHAFCLTAGAGSPITGACNNTALHANANTGSNGAATN
jgi:hypothetical protein